MVSVLNLIGAASRAVLKAKGIDGGELRAAEMPDGSIRVSYVLGVGVVIDKHEVYGATTPTERITLVSKYLDDIAAKIKESFS